MSYKEKGKISHINVETRGSKVTVSQYFMIDFGSSVQGFGGMLLANAVQKKFDQDICRVFGVKKLGDLIGKKCVAYRCFPDLNSRIEGLRSVDTGKLLSITAWWKKNINKDILDPLQLRRKQIESEISFWTRRVAEEKQRLKEVDKEYRPVK